jgi:hypothetical protein
VRRRDFITLLPFAAGLPSAAVAEVDETRFARAHDLRVNVKRDFGAKGDGVTDDWQAIENAGVFLAARGGGQMYFPEGRYSLPTFGRNLTVRNRIEYFGDGERSVIVGNNAVFISPNGAIFGRNSYAHYEYYPAHDIAAGVQSIALNSPDDARHFSPGDIIIARSIVVLQASKNDVLPYFVEMNRVTRVFDGVIYLEDPVDDDWSGIIVAKATPDVSQDYAIHDLRIECEGGFPFFMQASYKGLIRNCSVRGVSAFSANAFTRSVARDIVGTVLWSAERKAPIIEIETGSVGALLHDFEVQIDGTSAQGNQYPLFYCQEFSRRTTVRNVRITSGPDIVLGEIVMAMVGGHTLENIHIVARSFDKLLDYSCSDPGVLSLNHLPLTLKRITIDTTDADNGFNHGFILHNDHPGGTVENVTVQDCVINGVIDRQEHNLIWFLQGEQKNILFDNVRGAGDVKLGAAGLSSENSDDRSGGGLRRSLTHVAIRNCEYHRIASRSMLQQATFTGCKRRDSLLPEPTLLPAVMAWTSTVANAALMALSIPPHAVVCWGDTIAVKFAASYPVQPAVARVAVKVFGVVVVTMDQASLIDRQFAIELQVRLGGRSFGAPDKYAVTGTLTTKDHAVVQQIRSAGRFDAEIANTIELQAWSEKAGDGAVFVVKAASMEYLPVEE